MSERREVRGWVGAWMHWETPYVAHRIRVGEDSNCGDDTPVVIRHADDDASLLKELERLRLSERQVIENYQEEMRERYTPTTSPPDEREILWCLEGISAIYPIVLDAARLIWDRRKEITRLRDEVSSLTERLTITPDKVKVVWGRVATLGVGKIEAVLRAAGMIDPEVGG